MSFDERSEARFGVYVEALTGVIGHADRATPLCHYCTGLLMPAARKSVEPMAAMTAPARAAAQHGYARAHGRDAEGEHRRRSPPCLQPPGDGHGRFRSSGGIGAHRPGGLWVRCAAGNPLGMTGHRHRAGKGR
jgi:hypothetical protein